MPLASQPILFSIRSLAASLFCCNFLQFHGPASKRAQLRRWMNALIYSASASVLPLHSYHVMTRARVHVRVLGGGGGGGERSYERNMSSVALEPCCKNVL